MGAREHAILGTERALAGYPDIDVGPVLKAFPDIRVGQVLKIHRGELEGLPSAGDALGVVVLKPRGKRGGIRIAPGPEDPNLLADLLAEVPEAEGALALSVLDSSGWAVTCEVMDVKSAAEDE